jgi:hypothetical protein
LQTSTPMQLDGESSSEIEERTVLETHSHTAFTTDIKREICTVREIHDPETEDF